MLNRAALVRDAQALLTAQAAENEYLIAGADAASALGACAEIEITADDRGLVTRVVEAPQAFFAPPAELPAQANLPGSVAPPVPLHQPINAYRVVGPYLEDLTPIRFTALLAREIGGFRKPDGYDDVIAPPPDAA